MRILELCLLLTALLGVLVPRPADAQPLTMRVSVGSGNIQANRTSVGQSLSADGRCVAFDSTASNLVPNDTNGAFDVFVHDRHTGTTTRVSVGPGGTQGNGSSSNGTISGDGRYVVFESSATNLVAEDTNAVKDAFVHDRQTGRTTRVSTAGDGGQANAESRGPAVSADGRWVAFDSSATNLVQGDTNGFSDVFGYDLLTGVLTRASRGPAAVEGNQHSSRAAVSTDGRWIAFASTADNLVVGDSNGWSDIFVHDPVETTPVAPSGLVFDDMVGNVVTLRWTSPGFGPAPTNGTPPQTIVVPAAAESTGPSRETAGRSTSAAGAFLTAAWPDAR